MAAERTRQEGGSKRRSSAGSALILAVVLTSLLAMVGVLFVLTARMDRMGTAAVSDNRNLTQAVETVIARISEELALDVPGLGQEYYDYPDPCNAWLGNLEPRQTGGVTFWPRVSDLYNVLGANAENVEAVLVPAYQDPVTFAAGLEADADGDGVADSKWVLVEGVDSSKGRPIFAAIRIVDNGGMLNVNTGFKFDGAATDANFIDGSSLTQINLVALARQPDEGAPSPEQEDDLLGARANLGLDVDPFDLDAYERSVVWRYGAPEGPYTPFDISDELELRYRFLINHEDIASRLEVLGVPQWRPWGFREAAFRTPLDNAGDLGEWFFTSCAGGLPDPNYAYRHIATTYNMDRIIAPDGGPMVNVNQIYNENDVLKLFMAVRQELIDAGYGNDPMAAQIAANIKDYVDDDDEVTAFDGDNNGDVDAYGFESPCAYISELAVTYSESNDANLNKSYAVEFYKPYAEDGGLSGWMLEIDNGAVAGVNDVSKPVDWSGTSQFKVLYWKNPDAEFSEIKDTTPCDPNCDPNIDPNCDPNCDPNGGTAYFSIQPDKTIFVAGSKVRLLRPVEGEFVVVDSVEVPSWFLTTGSAGTLSFKRDITLHRCIKRLWDTGGSKKPTTNLGAVNDYNVPNEPPMQAHPADKPLTNIGEIGMVFSAPAYYRGQKPLAGEIGYDSNSRTEDAVRLDLGNPVFQPLVNYLTVFDPRVDFVDNDGDGLGRDGNGNGVLDGNEMDADELKIAGRINVNTAPWFVIAQLPWTQRELAQAIVAYRDRGRVPTGVVDYSGGRAAGMWGPTVPDPPPVREEPGFASVAELINVTYDLAQIGGNVAYPDNRYDIRRYGREQNAADPPIDQPGFPDLTTDSDTNVDGAANDFEERDLIFARLSNLVTVRSDVFTAYILVRIGTDGPQKRVIAILDRSNVSRDPISGVISGRVKIRAVQPVPDSR